MENEELIYNIQNLINKLNYYYNKNKEIKEGHYPKYLIKYLFLCNMTNNSIFRNILLKRIDSLKGNKKYKINKDFKFVINMFVEESTPAWKHNIYKYRLLFLNDWLKELKS